MKSSHITERPDLGKHLFDTLNAVNKAQAAALAGVEPITAKPVEDDGLVTVRLAPHVVAHIHWVLAQHGWSVTQKVRDAEKSTNELVARHAEKLKAESLVNGVALAVFTQLVKR